MTACKAKKMASTAAVTTGRAFLHGFSLKGGSTASSVLFKNGGTGGTEMWSAFIKLQTVAGDDSVEMTFPTPIEFKDSLHATLAGTNAVLYVAYTEGP